MIDILRVRRSIRQYENKKIDDKTVELLKEAILRSPSGMGLNPWTFIFVDNPDLLKKLSMVKKQGSAFLKKAALGIVVCGDEKVSDIWPENCSIASIIVQLTAQSLGLGSCWIQIRNRPHSNEKSAEAYIQELLGIPENIKVECIVSIGYPAENKKSVPKNDLDYSKIKYNTFNK